MTAAPAVPDTMYPRQSAEESLRQAEEAFAKLIAFDNYSFRKDKESESGESHEEDSDKLSYYKCKRADYLERYINNLELE